MDVHRHMMNRYTILTASSATPFIDVDQPLSIQRILFPKKVDPKDMASVLGKLLRCTRPKPIRLPIPNSFPWPFPCPVPPFFGSSSCPAASLTSETLFWLLCCDVRLPFDFMHECRWVEVGLYAAGRHCWDGKRIPRFRWPQTVPCCSENYVLPVLCTFYITAKLSSVGIPDACLNFGRCRHVVMLMPSLAT